MSSRPGDQARAPVAHQTHEPNQVRHQPRYQPFYCEENIWWLCAEPPPGVRIEQVVFVAGLHGVCPIAEQHAGGVDGLVWWDYHCIGLDQERRIWDLDSRLPLPVAASIWLERSFPRAAELQAPLQPLFRLVPGTHYLQDFRSDRRHMRTADGRWQQPPPPWAYIGSFGRPVMPSAEREDVELGAQAERPSTGADHAKTATAADTGRADRQPGASGNLTADADSNLAVYRDLSTPDGPGVVLDLAAFRAFCC